MLKSFAPVINQKSKVLILGSMPGIKSLEAAQYYAHPYNRFWKIMAIICKYPDLDKANYEIKTKTLLKNGFALWDVVKTCNRNGSLDTNIQNVKPNNISDLIEKYPNINKICCNGNKAFELFNKYSKAIMQEQKTEIIKLPSTSPANAKYSFEMLLNEWILVK